MGKRRRHTNYDPTKSWPTKDNRPKSTADERMAFVREQWDRDINISINGRNGMQQRLREVFGVPARDEQLMAIRSEVIAKKKREASFGNPVVKPEARQALRSATLPAPDSPRAPSTPPAKQPDTKPRAPYLEVVKPKEPKMTDDEDRKTIPVVPAPGTSRSIDDANVRYQFARAYLQRHPAAVGDDIIEAVRAEFGIGISSDAVGTLKRELGIGMTRRRRHERAARPVSHMRMPVEEAQEPAAAPPAAAAAAAPPAAAPPPAAAAPPPAAVRRVEPRRREVAPEEAIRAAVQLLLEEVPTLKRLSVDLVDGKPKVSFEVEVTRTRAGEVEL